MKALIIGALVLATVPQHKKDNEKLGDSYAKAALLAAKTIRADRSLPKYENGEALANRHTIEAINTADAEATTKSEKNVTAALNRIYTALLLHNSSRDFIETNYVISIRESNELIKNMKVDEAMSKDEKVLRMKAQEASCFDALEDSLRSRSSVIPNSCSDQAFTAASN